MTCCSRTTFRPIRRVWRNKPRPIWKKWKHLLIFFDHTLVRKTQWENTPKKRRERQHYNKTVTRLHSCQLLKHLIDQRGLDGDCFLNIGMEYVKIIKAETLNLMINSYYLNNILWSTHLPKHKHKACTTPTIIPLTLTHHLSTKSSPKPHLKKTSKPSMTRWTPT